MSDLASESVRRKAGAIMHDGQMVYVQVEPSPQSGYTRLRWTFCGESGYLEFGPADGAYVAGMLAVLSGVTT